MRLKIKRTVAILSLILLTSFAITAAAGTREAAADNAAQKWLAVVDGGHYDESWDGASSGFKGAVTRQQWHDSLTAVRQPLGDLKSRALKSSDYETSLPGTPDGEYVVLTYSTSFANKKEAVETLTVTLDKSGAWRAAGYFIR